MQTFSKREQISSSTQYKWRVPACRQTTRVNPTPFHMGRGLAGHPRSVRLGYGDNKTRLLTAVRSKTPALQRHGSHLCSEQRRTHRALRGDDFAGKGRRRNDSSSPERVRLLQLLLPRPKKDGGLRPILDLRLLNRALVMRGSGFFPTHGSRFYEIFGPPAPLYLFLQPAPPRPAPATIK